MDDGRDRAISHCPSPSLSLLTFPPLFPPSVLPPPPLPPSPSSSPRSGDIAVLCVEAVVNPTNESLSDKNAISSRLLEMAGPELKDECKTQVGSELVQHTPLSVCPQAMSTCMLVGGRGDPELLWQQLSVFHPEILLREGESAR